MAIEWKDASKKFKIAWFSWLIGAPVISFVIWRMQIPYIEIYLTIIAAGAWTAAVLYKRRKRMAAGPAQEKHDESIQGGHR